eukprot:s13121_g2.t1
MVLGRTMITQRGMENLSIVTTIDKLSVPRNCGYDFKPTLPPAGPDLFLRRSWPPLHPVAPSLIACTGSVRGPQLRRITSAISDGELRTSGPVVKVAGAVCTAMVQITLFCRLQNLSQAEAGSHRRLYIVLSPIWSTLARLPSQPWTLGLLQSL